MLIYSLHAFARGKPLDYPIREFEDRKEAIEAATSYALYGGDYLIKTLTDDRAVEYPREEIYISGVRNKGKK